MDRKIIFGIGLMAMILFGAGTTINSYVNELSRSDKEKILPNITFHTTEGLPVSRESLTGKPLLLVYFSPECSYSRKQADLLRARDALPQGVQVLLVSPFEKESVKHFAREYSLQDHPYIRVALDEQKQFAKHYKIDGYPALFLYDRELHLAKSFGEMTRPEELRKVLDSMEQ